MVNGAGLAMATMDIIKLAGGSPANFWTSAASARAPTRSKERLPHACWPTATCGPC